MRQDQCGCTGFASETIVQADVVYLGKGQGYCSFFLIVFGLGDSSALRKTSAQPRYSAGDSRRRNVERSRWFAISGIFASTSDKWRFCFVLFFNASCKILCATSRPNFAPRSIVTRSAKITP